MGWKTDDSQAAEPGQLEALFRSIVADVDAVYRAYTAAGLLSDAKRGSLACTLLGGDETTDRFRREVLLVDALLRHRVARLAFKRQGSRHIVVFGGNNVGKSTVINILAAQAIAGTSPEGGHTRHAEAYSADAAPLFAWNPFAFSRFRLVNDAQLSAEDFDCYTVVSRSAGVLPDNVVLWDAPDCDAVGSGRYVAAVVETIAAADLVIYVTSVEKYTVSDLVEWFCHIDDAGIPILECLNKTPKKDRAVVMRKQADDVFRLVAERLNLPVPAPRVVALRYMTEGEEADLWGPDHPEAAELREAALASLAAPDELTEAYTALRSITRRVDRLLEPAHLELFAKATWTALIETAVAGFVTTYDDEYLSGNAAMAPFQRLNGQLLQLLNPDIPYLNGVINKLRVVQRFQTGLLKKAARGIANYLSDKGGWVQDSKLGPELQAYTTAHRALLSILARSIDHEQRNSRHHPFWDQLAARWDSHVATLTDEFDQATAVYLERTHAEIEQAARDILQVLQQSPNLLKLLKAARVSTDVGGVVLGFFIPGHGHIIHNLLEDLVIAPAMLSATGATAEFIVNDYVGRRRHRVIEDLRLQVRAMATSLYVGPLTGLGDDALSGTGALGLQQDLLDRIPADLLRLQKATAGRLANADVSAADT